MNLELIADFRHNRTEILNTVTICTSQNVTRHIWNFDTLTMKPKHKGILNLEGLSFGVSEEQNSTTVNVDAINGANGKL